MTNDYAASEWARIDARGKLHTGQHGIECGVCQAERDYQRATPDPDPVRPPETDAEPLMWTCPICGVTSELPYAGTFVHRCADPEAPSGRAIVWLLVALVIAAVVAWRIVR